MIIICRIIGHIQGFISICLNYLCIKIMYNGNINFYSSKITISSRPLNCVNIYHTWIFYHLSVHPWYIMWIRTVIAYISPWIFYFCTLLKYDMRSLLQDEELISLPIDRFPSIIFITWKSYTLCHITFSYLLFGKCMAYRRVISCSIFYKKIFSPAQLT